jgi:hypothetical protein
MLPLPRRTSPRIAAGSPQDSGLPAASASSARPLSSGPSASLGATSVPADTLSPRRLWHLPAISAAYRRASGGAGAVPSFAHRGLSSAHALTGSAFQQCYELCSFLAPQWLGEVSPIPSRPRPDALIARPAARSPRRPRTPATPPHKAGFPGARQPPILKTAAVLGGAGAA